MMQNQLPGILSLMTFLPLIGALIVMFLPRPNDLPEEHGGHDDHASHGEPLAPNVPEPVDLGRMLVNGVSLAFAMLTFLVSIALFGAFESGYLKPHLGGIGANMQFIEDVPWIRISAGHWVHYHMGVDGISLLLVLLTTFLMVLCILFSFRTKQRLKEFMVFLLLLESAMVGVFCALDLVLFYVFFEAMLIPMYFLIGIFGHENRIYAAIKFFIYTFAGSVLMLIAIVAVYSATGTFDILALTDPGSHAAQTLQGLNPQMLMWMFGAFALAFMIKVPMFPFHTWLPDAHVEAPTAGSVILAGVMLKMGTYGFVRICVPLFPLQAQSMAPVFILLAIVGIVYASLVAAVQPDAKKLVAYSSVAHLGFVVLGIFTFTRIGMMGALVQNINHGISTPMLFFIVGMMYERRHTREINEYGGLKKIVPMMATMLLIATLASIAVPFFNGFVGEFPVLLGSWMSARTYQFGGLWPTVLAASGMIWSAVYMLWWYQRLMLGPVTKPANRRLPDLSRTEWAVLTPLAALIFWFGLGSNYWTRRMETAVNLLLPVGREQLRDDVPESVKLDDELGQWERQRIVREDQESASSLTPGRPNPGARPTRPRTAGGPQAPGGMGRPGGGMGRPGGAPGGTEGPRGGPGGGPGSFNRPGGGPGGMGRPMSGPGGGMGRPGGGPGVGGGLNGGPGGRPGGAPGGPMGMPGGMGRPGGGPGGFNRPGGAPGGMGGPGGAGMPGGMGRPGGAPGSSTPNTQHPTPAPNGAGVHPSSAPGNQTTGSNVAPKTESHP
jgi:NADH-quinone oxidoreductase subunit M